MSFLVDRYKSIRAGWTLNELSGALGDLGTFLPLVLAMVQAVGLDLGTTLIATGLYNIASGVQFGLPMCVQPMHAICAVALSEAGITLPQVLLAGVFVGATVLLLGATGLMAAFATFVPTPVVRGIQLGVGLKLAGKGMSLAFMRKVAGGGVEFRPWWGGGDGLLLALAAFAFVVVATFPLLVSDQAGRSEQGAEEGEGVLGKALVLWARQRASCDLPRTLKDTSPSSTDEQTHLLPTSSDPLPTAPSTSSDPPPSPCTSASCPPCQDVLTPSSSLPSALILIGCGLLLAVILHPHSLSSLSLGPSTPHILHPTWSDLWAGITSMGVPQLPLTMLNSVIATAHLANELFPTQPTRPGTVAVSVGSMNLVGIWLGAMPSCHGAGGMAAQVKFGATSGAAPVMLGLIKLVLGLVLGSSLQGLLGSFPQGLMGVMLAFAGMELASVARKQGPGRGYVLMLVTAAGCVGLNSTWWGFVAGIGVHLLAVGYEVSVLLVRQWRE